MPKAQIAHIQTLPDKLNLWLKLGLGLLIGGLLFLFLGTLPAEEPQARIQDNFIEQLTQLSRQHSKILSQAEQLATKDDDAGVRPFQSFRANLNFPYFIYRNGQPWFWSSLQHGPFRETSLGESFQFHQTVQGSIISKTTAFQGRNGISGSLTTVLPLSGRELAGGDSPFFDRAVVGISPSPGPELVPIADVDGDSLFYVQLAAKPNLGYTWPFALAAWLLVLGHVFLGIGLVRAGHSTSPKSYIRWALLLALALLRVLFIELNIPSVIYPIELFSPRYFASGWLNPSLADFMLNMAWYGGIWYLLSPTIYQMGVWRWLYRQSPSLRWFVGISGISLLVILNILLVRTLIRHVQFPLDITENISLNLPRLATYLIFISCAIILYFQLMPLYRYMVRQAFSKKLVVTLLVVGCLWALVFHLLATYGFIVILLILGWIFMKKYQFGISQSVLTPSRQPFPLFSEILGVALITASIGGVGTLDQYLVRQEAAQEQLASQILSEQDVVGEFLLSEAAGRMQQDIYMVNRFLSPLFTLEGMNQKVRRVYLSKYFDKYSLEVNLFSPDGQPLRNNQLVSYSSLLGEAKRLGTETEYPGLYRLQNPAASWQYHYRYFMPILFQGTKIGYVTLDLQLRQLGGETLYPELLLNNQSPQLDASRYSFAIYRNDKLEFYNGSYNYPENFSADYLKQDQVFKDEGFRKGEHIHWATAGTNSTVVISAYELGPLKFYANFAFLLLFLLLVVSLYYLLYLALARASVQYLSLTTKVQLYLNAAILIPLLVITFSTLSFLNRTYRKQTEETYTAKAERISRGVAESLIQYQAGYTSTEQLAGLVEDMARFADADIHLFDTSGYLLATNQPTLFQKYLSPYVNPQAMGGLVEANQRQMLTTEEINNLEYKAAYVSVMNPTTGKLLGVVGVPFFDAGYRLQEQLSSIFSNFVAIFATLFFVFLFLLQLLARGLTDPLRYIAERLRFTSLSGKNEPLEWPANDEIGRLVHEYNQMLLNLQKSKEALSQSEKESAWREMAKQVAHEIKNPLTPMRLSLQHLNRRLDSLLEHPQREKVNQSFQSLLGQVETLSDIATTFSAFAKMPIPRQDKFDFTAMVRRVVNLFQNNSEKGIALNLPKETVWIEGDEQLMQRTLNNLIINGQQAVPDTHKAQISIKLSASPTHVLLQVKDNGSGIPAAIQQKVFVPNFSTKNSGSGLGLAIAKRGVEHAGGKIWFETEEDVGTTFYIDLPRSV